MAKETTIDWIKREMEKFGERSHLLLDWESFDIIIEDAREMEKEQMGYTEEQAYEIWKAGQEYWKTSGKSITFEELTEKFKPKSTL